MGQIIIKPKSLSEIKIIAKEALQTSNISFKSQVVAVFDVSGSMEEFYTSGIVEALATRILGLALHLDDNGSVPVYALDRGVKRLSEDLTERTLDRFIPQLYKMVGGGTDYAPTINKVVDDAEAGDPMLVIVFTDGENSDYQEAEEAIVKASKLPIFFQWYGIYQGKRAPSFRFLEKLDTLRGRQVDNCGFSPLGLSIQKQSLVSIDEFNDTSHDQELYADMLKEYKDFPAKAAAADVKWENKRRKFLGIF